MSTTPSSTDDKGTRSGVGFFRGLLAVFRGIIHGVGTVIALIGRGIAAITRRSRKTESDATNDS